MWLLTGDSSGGHSQILRLHILDTFVPLQLMCLALGCGVASPTMHGHSVNQELLSLNGRWKIGGG